MRVGYINSFKRTGLRAVDPVMPVTNTIIIDYKPKIYFYETNAIVYLTGNVTNYAYPVVHEAYGNWTNTPSLNK